MLVPSLFDRVLECGWTPPLAAASAFPLDCPGVNAMDLDARIARLERRNRVLTCVAVLAAMAAPIGYLSPRLGAADDSKGTGADIAERLVLRSASGAVAATLVAAPSGANLSLCDATGKPRIVFAVGKDGPSLVFLDANQSSANKGVRVAISANPKSGPSVALFGDDAATPLASVRTKSAAGSTTASGVFVAVNDENLPVAFPRGTKADAEPKPAATTTSSRN